MKKQNQFKKDSEVKNVLTRQYRTLSHLKTAKSMRLHTEVLLLPLQQHLAKNILLQRILKIVPSSLEIFPLVKLRTRIIFMGRLVRIGGKIAFSRGNVIGSEDFSIEPGSLDLFEILHSLAMLFVHLLDFLFLGGGFGMEGLRVPFELVFVADDKGLETEDIDVTFVFERGNDGLRELAFLEDVDQDG